jgi:hypothetical protein
VFVAIHVEEFEKLGWPELRDEAHGLFPPRRLRAGVVSAMSRGRPKAIPIDTVLAMCSANVSRISPNGLHARSELSRWCGGAITLRGNMGTAESMAEATAVVLGRIVNKE